MYYWFVAHYRFVFFSSQAIAKKVANQTSRSSFVYEIIVVYSLIVARIAKINVVATIANVANEIENLN